MRKRLRLSVLLLMLIDIHVKLYALWCSVILYCNGLRKEFIYFVWWWSITRKKIMTGNCIIACSTWCKVSVIFLTNKFISHYSIIPNKYYVIKIFITYFLVYPVDISHYINFNYYTQYFSTTHNIKNVTWRPVPTRVNCDVTNANCMYM
jgi:hypothetical protein